MTRTASWLTLIPIFVFGFVVAGCGGGGNSVQGSVGGKGIGSAHAVSNVSGTAPAQSAAVIISNISDLCARITDNKEPTNAQALTLQFGDSDAAGNTSAPSHSGTYVITTSTAPGAGQFATAVFSTIGAQTTDTSETQAGAGTVTLTDVATGTYGGSFDLTFGSDHLTGSFDSSNCPGL
jgi:hypothetical protein